MNEEGFDFDETVAGYEEELEERLRKILRDYVRGADIEEVVHRILPVAQRYAGAYEHAVERRRIRHKRRSEGG